MAVFIKHEQRSQSTAEGSRAIRMAPHFLFATYLWIICSITAILGLPPTKPPLIKDHPFVAIWNAPITTCHKHEIPLDLAAFQVVTTPAAVPGQFLFIFYEERLGLYPKVDTATQKSLRGGVPQNGTLMAHLAKARSEIKEFISQDSPGLAVIDWEAWRPLWDRNWGSKLIYKKLSIDHAQKTNSSSKDITKVAKSQFEQAGRSFMVKTLNLGISERPSHLWGFYLFPDCYNYGWEESGYTGRCSAKTKEQNNQLLWLWKRSTALFPSVYIAEGLRNSPHAKLYVRNRVQEALRVAMLPEHPATAPTYAYSRIMYRKKNDKFLSQMDLVSTVGEIAALGASGVILWGASSDYTDEASCQSLSQYLTSTLNLYIANVTAATTLCSEVLCQGRGRCIRKDYDSAHYLHLNPANFSIQQADGKYVASGHPSAADMDAWAENFTCQCYEGRQCSPRLVHPTAVKHIVV